MVWGVGWLQPPACNDTQGPSEITLLWAGIFGDCLREGAVAKVFRV